MNSELKKLLANTRPPAPPPELRDRTLRVALGAAGRQSKQDRWSQIWHSLPLRYAWAASLACLLLAHILISAAPQSWPTASRGFALNQISEVTEEEIRGIATLLRVDLDPRSLSDAMRVSAASENAPKPETSNAKENT
jgi:hypothetical protein